nr:hypothetical protein [Rubripirellula sp.]
MNLPAEGLWQPHDPDHQNAFRELYLVPSGSWRARQIGKRMYTVMETDAINSGRWHIQRGYGDCREFALEGNKVGPASMQELVDFQQSKKHVSQWNSLEGSSRGLTDLFEKQIEGPFIYLIPRVKFELVKQAPHPHELAQAKNGYRPPVRWDVPREKRRPLAFEIRPLVDDNKHWMLYTDGSSERIVIDKDLLKRTGQTIRPLISKQERKTANERETIPYKFVGLANSPLSKTLNIEVRNHVLNKNQNLTWKITAKNKKLDKPRDVVMQARLTDWTPYLSQSSGTVLHDWTNNSIRMRENNRRGRTTSAFSVLGGRAAVEETLQMQVLTVQDQPEQASKDQNLSIDINSIEGVNVESHPFKEMLAGKSGGQLELAKYAPQDRFFLYVGKPATVARMLDAGSPFIASVGAAITGNSLNYGLQQRYLRQLGLSRDQLDAILKTGLIREMAMFCPDLFFIDGTDLTVIAKVEQPELVNGLLRLLNPTGDQSQSIMKMPGADDPAYVALRGDLLFLATSLSELKKSLELHANNGQNSLGESDEFRYMLTKLGITEKTRAYAYFSDPFVRRLVSPEVKIGQLRRILAKKEMEALTARAMLAKLDDPDAIMDCEQLKKNGYISESWPEQEYHLDASGLVHSETYGTLKNTRSLTESPLNKATGTEAKAYAEYLQNYSRYWRRFFDPIAIRLDESAAQQLEVSTFILPLIDNSIYNTLRMALETDRTANVLAVPTIEPTPVVKFSLNLSDMAWDGIAEGFSDLFTRYSGTSAAVLDDLGPSIHLAIFDSDPIIALGSGDVFGSFGSSMNGMNSDAIMIPIALSMFTRPCSIFINTRNPDRTSQLLRQAATLFAAPANGFDDFRVQIFQVGDQEKWVWMMDIMGMVKLRYGIEIVGDYVVVRNIPWSTKEKVAQVKAADLNAASLQVNPDACIEQIPGLFAAASDANSRVAMSGLGRLLPFMVGKDIGVEEARQEHQRLFGFFPKTVLGDQLKWQYQHLSSNDYGDPMRQRQPAFDAKKPFGLMNQIESLRLEMQFEDDGLRSAIRWRMRQPK